MYARGEISSFTKGWLFVVLIVDDVDAHQPTHLACVRVCLLDFPLFPAPCHDLHLLLGGFFVYNLTRIFAVFVPTYTPPLRIHHWLCTTIG